MLPLSTVLSVTMTQIVSTQVSLLQGARHPGHTPAPASQSALYPLLTDMFPLDLLQNLVSLLVLDTAAFLTVSGPLMQHCQQEAASTKLVSSKSLLLSLSKLMDMDQLRVSHSGQPPGLI